MLDRHGRCIKLFVSTESTSCQAFASQFDLDIFYTGKTPKTMAKTDCRASLCLMKQSAVEKGRYYVTNHGHGRSIDRQRPAGTATIIAATGFIPIIIASPKCLYSACVRKSQQ